MPEGTLVFVHGTGERLKSMEPFLNELQAQLNRFHINYALDPVVWGDAVGVEFEGKSLPDPPRPPAREHALAEYAEWTYLAADPLFGLRLLSLPDRFSTVASGSGLLGQPKWLAAWELVKEYRPSPDLQALLDRGSLVRYWESSSSSILDDPVARQAFAASGDNTAEPLQALARAMVAHLLLEAQDNDACIPPSTALRDKLYDRLVYDWGASVKGIGDRISRFVENAATRLLRNYRREWSNAASLKLGDILLYQVHGLQIREFIAEKIAVCAPPVVLMAHSLGGTACVDLLAGPAPPTVAKLVTLGSQAPLFFEVGALQSLIGKSDLPDSFPPWLNFFDRNDFLSYVGGSLFSKIEDQEIQSGLPFPASHSGYFSCDETWAAIKTFLDRT